MRHSMTMREILVIKWSLVSLVIVLAVLGSSVQTIWALDSGTYLVTVKPSYKDPETGNVEDPGNNEAIGQGMTERMCGSTGLLEIDTNGEMYLTVRYYLSQFIKDVSFDERIGGTYSSLVFQEMQTKAPIDGASDISDKYGYTDYRFKISSKDSVFRGKAYIDAMGRSVVYFFTCSNPMPGRGDFVTSLSAATETEAASVTREEQIVSETGTVDIDAAKASEQKPASTYIPETAAVVKNEEINGSGDADAQVTGIPQKPAAETAGETGLRQSGEVSGSSQPMGEASGITDTVATERYYLETIYNLTDVPIKEARKLVEPLLEDAVGITGMVGSAEYQTAAASMGSAGFNGNKTIMLLLLAIAATLMAHFAITAIRRQRRLMIHRPDRQNNADFESPEYQEAAEQLEQQYREAQARLQQEFKKKAQPEGDYHEN